MEWLILLMFNLTLIYYVSIDVRFFIDKNIVYKGYKTYLINKGIRGARYVIVLEEISDELVLIKEYNKFDVDRKFINKSKLIEIKGNK